MMLPADQIRALKDRFEPERTQALRARDGRRRLWFILAPLGMAALALGIWLSGQDLDLLFFVPVLAGAAYAWVGAPLRAYAQKVKAEAFPALLSRYGEDFHIEPRGRIPMPELKKSGLIPAHDDAKFEDLITGTWEGLPVEVVEAKLTQTHGSGKDRRTVTVFKGLFVRFGMHKPFSGKTVVRADKGFFNRFESLFGKMERVRLEDPDFEKRFEVYSTDQVEARYLLTLTFMERVRRLAEQPRFGRGGPGKVQLAFYDERLFLMLPLRRNLFEVGDVADPDHLDRDFAALAEDMDGIFGLAETLRLNQDSHL